MGLPDMIVIVDYGMGNLRSIQKTFERLEIPSKISGEAATIAQAGKLVLPGVGHFGRGMQNIRELGLLEVLNQKARVDRTPILGICLGMQLFCRRSDEGDAEGLGWLDAETVRFEVSDPIRYKIPHIGWNSLNIEKENSLFAGVEASDLVYFVHSYHVVSHASADALSTTTYDYDFVSAVQLDNLYGTQFHPEKSHKVGQKMLRNFAELK